MLKQWFVGRKRYSSTHFTSGYIQDPAIIGPLGEKYVVYRTNPIYAEDSHWIADAKITSLAVVAPHEPKLHVQAWCSLVCPNHLTTCCSCKPAWIYCDNCHPPPPPRRHRSHPVSPDVVPPLAATKKTVARMPDIALDPSSLDLADVADMDVSHYYHVIGPTTPPPGEEIRYYEPGLEMPNNNNIAENNNYNSGKLPENSPVLHIYINSDFVRGIAVTGSKAMLRHPNDASATGQPMAARERLTDADGLDISGETDSLDSLRIDEEMFDPEADGAPDGHRAEVIDVISPTSSHRLLTDSELAYEAVRDLYEKLSSNRQRQVVTQAVIGTQRTKVLRSYVQNTYETLTKQTRGHYGKLVEMEAKRPPLYLVPIGSMPRGRPIPEARDAKASPDDKNQSLRVLTGLRIETGKRNSDHFRGRCQSEAVPIDNSVPDVAYEVATSDQFITRRDPKYGDQVVQTSGAVTNQISPPRLFEDFRKRFKQKNYRDACKIIITTLVGLTAFGIITALSLSINRQ